jgi:hypothetical protein
LGTGKHNFSKTFFPRVSAMDHPTPKFAKIRHVATGRNEIDKNLGKVHVSGLDLHTKNPLKGKTQLKMPMSVMS